MGLKEIVAGVTQTSGLLYRRPLVGRRANRGGRGIGWPSKQESALQQTSGLRYLGYEGLSLPRCVTSLNEHSSMPKSVRVLRISGAQRVFTSMARSTR